MAGGGRRPRHPTGGSPRGKEGATEARGRGPVLPQAAGAGAGGVELAERRGGAWYGPVVGEPKQRPSLDARAVRGWLAGQRAAEERIRSERTRFLTSLTPERGLSLYLSLAGSAPPRPDPGPSPLLLAMRRALARLEVASA
jgi:hypothetical protein